MKNKKLKQKKPNIDWNYSGKPNLTVGTGATTTEYILVWIFGATGALIYIILWIKGFLNWSWWQTAIIAVLTFDIAGGIVANSLNSCKRFYHTPPKQDERGIVKLLKNHIFFSLIHIHPIVFTFIALGKLTNRGYVVRGDWITGFIWYFLLQVSALIVTFTPLYLKRPIAFILIGAAIVVNIYILPLPRSVTWLIPFLFIKLVYGHMVREEPYRP